ncbi:MAG: VOC family protein [Sideroxydans sp.]|nr:VOC family protein [Sideroxydans sp.]
MLNEQLSDLILGIDHVALAVTDIDSSLKVYAALGFSLLDHSEVHGDHSGMRYATLKCKDATLVLVQGTSPESQVSRFVAACGTGIHHIAYAVSDLDAAIHCAQQTGITVDTPIQSDEGIRQAFLHRDADTGVRIELIERHGAPFSEHNVEGLFRALEAQDLY